MNTENPLIIQGDRTLLLDVHSPLANAAREAIMAFAELEKSPEHIHTYRITPLSLWNAAAAGLSPENVKASLASFSRYDLPTGLLDTLADTMSRYGKIMMRGEGGEASTLPSTLALFVTDEDIKEEIASSKALARYLTPIQGAQSMGDFALKIEDRGTVKWELVKLGWPVKDEAPLVSGEPLEMSLREGLTLGGQPFGLRPYQSAARDAILGSGGPGTGYGVAALPCGSGKTIVGMACMASLKTNTLILTPNTAAVHQWIEELVDKTTLRREDIAEYTGSSKATAPVTIATYQILTWRPARDSEFPHFSLFRDRKWGFIIYDEVHLLPAPIFRVTAELQAARRLGLTATLIREDGNEGAVFSLVGPKRCDVPWKDLERSGWIAGAVCREIRLNLPERLKITYATATPREKYRIASENPDKDEAVRQLIENHSDDHILVIGQYIGQLERLAEMLDAPLVTGKVPNKKREEIYEDFKKGRKRVIVVSKVANFAIDLPDASMAIQVSGAFGSRQEEAQRLGRILRPKERNSYFYTLVSRYTVEEDFAANRQKFLAEQGYKYSIQAW